MSSTDFHTRYAVPRMKTKSNLGNDLKYGTLIDRSLRPVGRLLNVKSKGVLRVCRPQLLQKVRELKLLWPLEVDDPKPPSMDNVKSLFADQ